MLLVYMCTLVKIRIIPQYFEDLYKSDICSDATGILGKLYQISTGQKLLMMFFIITISIDLIFVNNSWKYLQSNLIEL